MSDKIAELEERIKRLEAMSLSQAFLNANFLTFNAYMAKRRLVEAPDGCKVRLYEIPVCYFDEDKDEIIPMEFITPEGVKSCQNITVFVAEPPVEEKK